jgi:catechol 2,3-dioxygenase-like lactoylglutathione lyase family enzyme
MAKAILGIHHLTVIAAEADQNLAFYAHLLGLRLVKITVNFHDPGSYHLYYGDSSLFLAETVLHGKVAPLAVRCETAC